MPKRVDDNQREIVKALRAVGACVQSLAEIGQGCPDLLVFYKPQPYWLVYISWKSSRRTAN